MPSPDFEISYHGTITLLRPLTDACREWIDKNVATEGQGAPQGRAASTPDRMAVRQKMAGPPQEFGSHVLRRT